MKRIIISVAALFFLLLAFSGHAGARGMGRYDDMPGPQLVSPILDNIVLSSGSGVKFKWLCGMLARIDHYEFRLYKGYQMYADTLIMKKDVRPGDCVFELPADTFELNQPYSWSLKAVYLNGQKSQESDSTFKIIKK